MKCRPCKCSCRPKNTLPSVLYTEGTEKVNQSVEEDLKKEDPESIESAVAAIEDNEVDG